MEPDVEASSLGTSAHSICRCNANRQGRKADNSYPTIMPEQGKIHSLVCNSGMRVLGETNSHLVELKACSTQRNSCLVLLIRAS